MPSGELHHPELGIIRITVRRSARRFVARWKSGVLALTVPVGASASEVMQALENMKERLLTKKSVDALYEFDREMVFECLTMTVKGVEDYGHRCTLHQVGGKNFEIRVDRRIDISAPEAVEAIGRMVKSVARFLAPGIILPHAAALALAVGARPSRWKISSGKKVLGRCNSRGEISLSAVLVFLPSELRNYVILHELAHLKEMNHSARFHAVCDKYCGGREHELEQRLKAFRFPLP